MTMQRQIGSRLFALLLALGLGLAGCGGESPSPSQPAAPSSTARRAAEPTTPPADVELTSVPDDAQPTRSSGGSGETPESFDVCALLPKEDIEAIIGKPIRESKVQTPVVKPGGASVQGCRYTLETLSDLSVEIYRFGDPARALQYQEVMGNLGEGTEIAGLGDKAAGESHDETSLGLLNVLSGPYYIELSSLGDAKDRLERLKHVAQLLLERLP